MKHREEKIDWNAIINSLPEKNEAFVEDKFVIPLLKTFLDIMKTQSLVKIHQKAQEDEQTF